MNWEYKENLFRCTKGKGYFNDKTGKITFPAKKEKTSKKRVKYTTVAGWGFAHSGIVYSNENECMQYALSRHMKRKTMECKSDQDEVNNLKLMFKELTEDKGFDFHESLIANQAAFYAQYSDEIRDAVREAIGEFSYFIPLVEASEMLTLEKHKKQKLRICVFKECDIDGRLAKATYMHVVTWFVKCPEIAKQGKAPRIVVDETTEGSLVRVHFANAWKAHTKNKEIKFRNVVVKYEADQSYQAFVDLFVKHRDLESKVYISNNSDDGLMTWVTDATRSTYMVDIATNDSAHGFAGHEHYCNVTCMDAEQRRNYMESVKKPIRVYNVDKSKSFTLEALVGYLPSGLGDTSVCNNRVYIDVGFLLDKLISLGHKMSIELLTCAGFLLGHRFSYVKVEKFSDMQFLKQSPFMIGNEVGHCVNLGVMFRYSGRVDGDLPEIKYPKSVSTLTDKWVYFQSLLTYGFFKYNRYAPLQSALCPMFDYINGTEGKHLENLEKYGHKIHMNHDDRPIIYHTVESFYSRYNVTSLDIKEFEELIGEAGFGTMTWCKLIDVVLETDYGLKW